MTHYYIAVIMEVGGGSVARRTAIAEGFGQAEEILSKHLRSKQYIHEIRRGMPAYLPVGVIASN